MKYLPLTAIAIVFMACGGSPFDDPAAQQSALRPRPPIDDPPPPPDDEPPPLRACALACDATSSCSQRCAHLGKASTCQQYGECVDLHTVGTLPGAMTVDSADGSAKYTIPLWTPPGRLGIEPSLSLSYSSRSGNGLLGVGWSLPGVSSTIEPCRKTQAMDGVNRAVRFDGQDPYCLDGARLVSTGQFLGTSACAGEEFRTIPDRQERIIACSVDLVGPVSWAVYTREGTVLRYGATADSRLDATATTDAPRAVRLGWLLSSTEDRSGNTLTIDYQREDADGLLQRRPNSIQYTAGPGMPATRRIAFEYEIRPDPARTFLRGTGTWSSKRLTKIAAYVGSQLMRRYDLSYVPSTLTSRSRLSAVTTCDGAGVCLPATRLTYASQPASWSGLPVEGGIDRYSRFHARDAKDGLRFADVNGDGRDDLIYWAKDEQGGKWWARLGEGSSFEANWRSQEGPPRGSPGWIDPWLFGSSWILPGDNDRPSLARFVDIDGDGAAELLAAGCACSNSSCDAAARNRCDLVWPFKFNGDHFRWVTSTQQALPSFPSGPLLTGTYVDEHGRGWSNYVFRNSASKYEVYGSGIPSDLLAPYYAGTPDPDQSFFRDLDGDGRVEFLFTLANGRMSLVTRAASVAVGAEVVPDVGLPYSPCHVWGDFTGDGLLDALDVGTGTLYRYDGYRFATLAGFLPPHGPFPACGQPFDDGGFRVLDYDKDGRADLLVLGKTTDAVEKARLYQTTYDSRRPESVGAFERVINELTLTSPDWRNLHGFTSQVIDVDVDGQPEVFQMTGDNTFEIRFRSRQPVDLLTEVVDGLGATARVEYDVLAPEPGNLHTPCMGAGCVRGGMTVVSYEHVDDGTTVARRRRHTYENGRFDTLAGGFLGFEKHKVIDLANGATTTSEYDLGVRPGLAGRERVHPYVGLAKTVTTTVQDGGIGHQTSVQSEPSIRLTTDGRSYFVFPIQTISTRSEQAGPNAAFTPLTTITTTTTGIDDLGNVTASVTDRGGGFRVSTTTTYADDLPQWLIGRRALVKVTSSAPGFPDETRSQRFKYQGPFLVESEREPGALGSSLYQRTKVTRDLFGQVTQVLVAPDLNDGGPQVRTTQYEYDSQSLFATATVNPLGHRSEITTDNRRGVQTASRDANGVVTNFDYDGFNRPRGIRNADGSSVALSYGAELPAWPMMVTTSRSDGSSGTVLMDRLGRETRTRTTAWAGATAEVSRSYDGLGRLRTVSQPRTGAASEITAARYEYDALGRVVRVYQHDGTRFAQTVYSQLATDSYDADGVHTRRELDPAGHVAKTAIFPATGAAETRFVHGPFDALKQIIDAQGNTVSIAYDNVGRRTAIDDRDTGARAWSYDGFDQVTTETDAKQQVTTLLYDALGRPVSRSDAGGSDTFAYDPVNGRGQIARATRGGVEQRFAYDSLARVTQKATTVDGASYVFDYGYDAQGRLSRTTYPTADQRPSRFAVDHVYDAWGTLRELRDVEKGRAIWAADEMDAAGHVTREVLGNGLVTTRAFDPATNLLALISTPGIPSYPQALSYGYSAAGRLLSRADAQLAKAESFTYDTAGRLASSAVSGSGPSARFTYDAIGNLTTSTDYFAGCTFEHGRAAGPHAVTGILCPTGTSYLSYDANGNMRASDRDGIREVAWTAFDKPAEMQNGYGRQRFTYDAHHTQVKKETLSTSGPTPYAAWSGIWGTTVTVGDYQRRSGGAMATTDHVFVVHAGSRAVAQLMWRWNGVSGRDEWRYFHDDRQQSIERTTNETGNAVEWTSFDAFGARRNYRWDGGTYAPPPDTRISYTGHDDDSEFGLVNMGGRIYNPRLKRFLSADPHVQAPHFGPSWNRYSYVFNDPLNHTDPTGYDATCDSASGDCGDGVPILVPGIPGQRIAPTSSAEIVRRASPPREVFIVRDPFTGAVKPSLLGGVPVCKPGDDLRSVIRTGGFLAPPGTFDNSPSVVTWAPNPVMPRGPDGHVMSPREYTLWRIKNVYPHLRDAPLAAISAGLQAGNPEQADRAAAMNANVWAPVAAFGAQESARAQSAPTNVGNAAPAQGGSIRNVNVGPGVRNMNCANCAIATDALLAGGPASALDSGAKSTTFVAHHFGKTSGDWIQGMGPNTVRTFIEISGPGARGIVFGDRGTVPGHFFNVVNQNGVVRFLDGQTGQPASLSGFNNFWLLMTNDTP